MRLLHFIFGLMAYAAFNAVFVYLAGFLANVYVPKSIDFPQVGVPLFQSLGIDTLLMLLFAVHHSVASRPFFKAWLTRHVPAHLERSVYVLVASLLLALIMGLWQPILGELWRVENVAGVWMIQMVFIVALLSPLAASFQIDHYDLFGMRQVYCHMRGLPYAPPRFDERGMYKVVRHPIMVGTMVAFWAVPVMTWGHFLWAAFMSAYIFIGIFLEERDMLTTLGEPYGLYRKRVPMLVPLIRRSVEER
ncbi:MAG: isoprenylcysteine carboxylmethyltransferase family protein [Magnetococcales bacterium]|nr:isoprenylcysteine carboxylmethyltransferase family protein [Magnetococcales bacterium]MBF0322129.1 isoprenylcysteine carboxylmethyltransferase family protein [Magnetococcales bacterium]